MIKKEIQRTTKDLWMLVDKRKYHLHVTTGSTTESEDTDEKTIYMEDLEKRTRVLPCWIRVSYFTVKSHLLIYFEDVVRYCEHGNLRNCLSQSEYINLNFKIVQCTKEADIYSFGIIMNEFMTEEIPYNNITHDYSLGVKICQQLKELYQILKKFYNERNNKNSEIHSQIVKCEKIRKNKLKISGSNESRFNKPENIQIHPKAIYTSRLLNFNNLPEPTNSSDLLFNLVQSPTENLISKCFDCQLSRRI
ncbi:unnamed protein product [Rhizophagus irregularis]|nr:unnamed protein product [Rhizophagus irregularis]